MNSCRRPLALLLATSLLLPAAAVALDAAGLGGGLSFTGPAGLVFGVLPDLAADGAGGGRSAAYRQGQQALDAGKWEEAAATFRRLAAEKGPETDAALYWLAYALAKDGRKADAVATVGELRSAYPKSGWLDDAQALEVELRGPRAPVPGGDSEEAEELKLLALNGLMQVEAARALPVLRKFLQGDASPRLKKQALFVLGQSDAPEARQLLLEVALGRAHPGLQEEAIRMLAIGGGKGSAATLSQVYRESSNREVKSAVLDAYLIAGAKDEMLAVAQTDRDPEMREEAINKLGAMGARQELRALYARESSRELKERLLRSMGVAGDLDGLLQAARAERDPELRAEAIQSMGIVGGPGTSAALKQLYQGADEQSKEAVIQALFVHGDAKTLIELFRTETDRERKRDIVQKLSLMHSPEATELLMKMLDE